MSPKARSEYVQFLVERYRAASRTKKSLILDELCLNCGYHRKYAIEKINTFNARLPKKKPGRSSHYDKPAILAPLKEVWLASNMPASKRLKAMIPYWLPFIKDVDKKIQAELLKVSPATIDRLLKLERLKNKPKGICTTKPGTLFRHQIPIKVDQWDEKRPGFLEADTVAHCGTSVEGRYAITLDCVDIATGWSEQRSTWGLNHKEVLGQIKHIEDSLPFRLLGFDSDCGHEFMNESLLRYLTDRKHPVQFTRSRPYKKDDNAHIEQKNWTHIRQWLGYERWDNLKIVGCLNDLFTQEWRLFFNFFMPSVKLLEKSRVGSKIIKKHDVPKTPYQRLLESPFIDEKIKDTLKEKYRSLNPFKLRNRIQKKLQNIKSILKSQDRYGKVLL
jgi:hypothetical protein